MYTVMTAVKDNTVSGGTVYVLPTRSQAEGLIPGIGVLFDQMVPRFIGGYKLYTKQLDNARIQEFALNQFQVGDVLVKLKKSGQETLTTHYYLYLGDGVFMHTDTSKAAGTYEFLNWSDNGVYGNCVWNSLAKFYDFFFLLRPTHTLE